MRHKIKTDRLDRFSSLRKATVNSIARSVIISHSVRTTYAKAKAAVGQIEHLITLSKSNTLSDRRRAYRVLLDHRLVTKLFGEIADLCKNRTSGYTRILKTGIRRGDGAMMVILELVDKPRKEKHIKKEKLKEIPKEHPVKEEEKPAFPKEETHKVVEKKKPTKKFLGGLRGFFKKERDSL